MKKYEGSPADKKSDKFGKHGKEGSPKDKAADKRGQEKMNKKKQY